MTRTALLRVHLIHTRPMTECQGILHKFHCHIPHTQTPRYSCTPGAVAACCNPHQESGIPSPRSGLPQKRRRTGINPPWTRLTETPGEEPQPPGRDSLGESTRKPRFLCIPGQWQPSPTPSSGPSNHLHPHAALPARQKSPVLDMLPSKRRSVEASKRLSVHLALHSPQCPSWLHSLLGAHVPIRARGCRQARRPMARLPRLHHSQTPHLRSPTLFFFP